MDDQQRIALVRVGAAHPDDRGPAVQFQMSDHLGSSNVVIDSDGALVNREEFTPYGETSFGSFARKRFRFTGKERDEESGLTYHGARYYTPGVTRWANCDPAGMAGGLNLYTYVLNNPLCLIDPSGLQPENLTPNAEGYYEWPGPGETIEVSGAIPGRDNFEACVQGRLCNDYDTLDEHEEELRAHSESLSGMRGGPEADAAYWRNFPEDARKRWDEYVTSSHSALRGRKVEAYQKDVRSINTAAYMAKVAAVVHGGAALLLAAPPLASAAVKSRAAYSVGTSVASSGPKIFASTVAYGVVAPPGAPNLPGFGDDLAQGWKKFLPEAATRSAASQAKFGLNRNHLAMLVSDEQFRTSLIAVESWLNRFLDRSVILGTPLRASHNRVLNSSHDPAVVAEHRRIVAQTARELFQQGDLPADLIPHYDAVLSFLGM